MTRVLQGFKGLRSGETSAKTNGQPARTDGRRADTTLPNPTSSTSSPQAPRTIDGRPETAGSTSQGSSELRVTMSTSDNTSGQWNDALRSKMVI
ncbi:hypothetical protein PV11_08201 [Exophiala sideris]|uniref:Uncharacterized protein n=1 Tax=Exophiala sideris TaxID=1016849 RepID=A0A0D1YCK6_9EURO|nr:hypothetical protein PV11_08201 [Exophiala sideris]